MKTTKTRRRAVLGLVALILALMAAPAAAAREREAGFRGWHREARHHGWWERERWRHRHFAYFVPAPYYAAPYCYRQQGYWAWDGWRHVWVPPATVCR